MNGTSPPNRQPAPGPLPVPLPVAAPDDSVPGRRRERSRPPSATPEVAHALRGVINRYELRNGVTFPRSVVVTPAGRNDDATGVARSLAGIFADEFGESTCWVDFGWLDGSSRPPVRSTGRREVGNVGGPTLTPTEHPQLTEARFAPVDPARGNAAVRSAEFVNEISVLDDKFDRLVFTVPSVLWNPAALAVLPHVDASILVTTYRSTRVQDVERALASMAPTPNLAVVVNRFDPSIPRMLRRLCGG